jgi:hypothetical protein
MEGELADADAESAMADVEEVAAKMVFREATERTKGENPTAG